MSAPNGNEIFWMGGRFATKATEISHDPESLDVDGFWAVQVNYEGRWTLTKFENVREEPFPKVSWEGITGDWSSSLDEIGYSNYVSKARESIAAGNFYQVNACRVLSARCDLELDGLFSATLENNPAPYAGFLRTADLEIASASPELFLSISSDVNGIHVKSSPIKGTSSNGEFGEKDKSENVMIVDLIRNDMSQVCKEGTVEVSRLLGIEKHPGLFHLVSDVVGLLCDDFSWAKFSKALLPAGSISGAPKSSALKFIAENEAARGPYCGLLGWIEKRGPNISGVLSVAIRTFWRENDVIHFGTGAGITWGSDPASEWEETELKAKKLMEIAQGRIGK
jgi:para-aminobenzoate synthetase component I